jgi:hypothetical protein
MAVEANHTIVIMTATMATYEQQNISQHEQIIDNVEKVSILSLN